MRRRRAVALLAVLCASCGAPLMKLPQGPGRPIGAVETAGAFGEATAACRRIDTLTAEVAVTGSAGGRRIRGRLSAGVAANASARLEAMAPFGPPLFIFVARGDDATLLLPRDARVLEHSRPDAVLTAIAGLPFDAADLHTILTGCADSAGAATATAQGSDWRLLMIEGNGHRALYLHRDASAQPWRLVAEIRTIANNRIWRAEYRDFRDGLPRSIHLASAADRPRDADRFDVTLALSQVETNVPLGAEAFTIQIPRNAEAISLEELRRSGPLAPRVDGR